MRGISCIKQDQAMTFLKAHDCTIAAYPNKDFIAAYSEVVDQLGNVVLERKDFRADLRGFYDLNAIRDWLGY